MACKGRTISFKKRRGGRVTIHHVGCGKRVGRGGAQRKRIAAAGRACRRHGRIGTAKNVACLKSHLRG